MAEIILMVVLLVLVIALFVISYLKKRKYNSNLNQLRDELKNGDKVMTDSGVVGEVVDSYEEDGYKYFVLKSGKDDKVGYYAVHANAIYYVFGKDLKDNTSEKVTVKVAPTVETDTQSDNK
ncbi:MAG: preprotein translocase subunit YajC [Clostridia bacterium]|nr:preprotein translocase subunit YajC [Clostridia bacterium]